MKKMFLTLASFLLLISQVAWADSGLTSKIVTDKMTYTGGEKVYVVIYVENKTGVGLMRSPDNDYYTPPYASLSSDAELSGGGQYYRKITNLPMRQSMGIADSATRPYVAFSFDLVDKNGNILPSGYYAISHTGIAFKGGVGDHSILVRASDAAQVIFVTDASAHDRIADITAVTTDTQQRVKQVQNDSNYLRNLTNNIYLLTQKIWSYLTSRH